MVCEESCQADKCENGGVCLVGFGSNCRCSNGTVSEFCSIVHILDCKKRKFCGTHNDSTCTYDKLHGKAVCQCTDPKKQFDYEERICKVPCGAENCENGGICDGKGDFKFCECLTGTSGDFCTEIPACRNGSLCGTSSDVRCVYDGIQQKSVCECLHTNAEFNNHTKKCGENNKSIFLALLGSLFAIFVIAFSILFHLRWRKHKAGDALYFNRLMERVGEE
ncbi:delta-like protein B isoform X2 [Stegodyphus dumicola]|uniref:delta-like protein B isoform X2 n=1 Tax=Stegodyphus dumicola TaxID=202533 RepID=UPI0015A9F95A|nr:delta-like protein B isoform X2 [Stegodyphus dumicola]